MRAFTVAVAIVLALLAAACAHEAVRSEKAGNDVTVDLLFEHDGVRVYRFVDGMTHYYAVPMNGVSTTVSSAWTECHSCGKNCTHCDEKRDETPTVARR